MWCRILFATILMAVPLSLTGQPAVNRTGAKADMTCVEDLQIPLYDGLMWDARATGSLEVSIGIGPGSAGRVLKIRGGPPVIAEALKAAISEGNFSSYCAGSVLEMHLIYRLAGPPDSSPHNRVRVRSNATFEIVARPHFPIAPQPSNGAKSPAETTPPTVGTSRPSGVIR